MRRFLLWLAVTTPLAIVLIFYAVANRHRVKINLDPFAALDQAVYYANPPVFVVVFAALAVGLLLGGFATWLGQHKWRKRARHETREAVKWKKEADRLNELMEASGPPRIEHAQGPGQSMDTPQPIS